ncbi:MAG: MEDS domain-containing protein [Myxococcota bacterium]
MAPDLDLGFTARRLPVGSHICYLFGEEDADRYEIMRRFFDAGGRAGEALLYLVDTLAPDALRRRLTPLSAPLDVRVAREAYAPDGHFSTERVFGALSAFCERARAAGSPSSRGSGEMSWALGYFEGTDPVLEYEARLNRFLPQVGMTAVCQYDLRRFDGATIMDVVAVHPYLILRGRLLENPLFEDPDVFLARLARRRIPAPAG